jgi:plasmid stability protein
MNMDSTTRATIYLDTALHRALRLKAASTRRSISALVADAVREPLREDQEDLSAVATRAAEPSVTYEVFLKKLKADGTL